MLDPNFLVASKQVFVVVFHRSGVVTYCQGRLQADALDARASIVHAHLQCK
jgi:hypothetical protein